MADRSANSFATVDTVMFDLDGTLVNSLDCYHAVFVDCFTQIGLPLVERSELIGLMRDGRNIIEMLVPAEWPRRDETKERCRTLFRELWAERSLTDIALHVEVLATVRWLLERDYVLGIATAAQGPWIVRMLHRHELATCFAAVVTYADVPVRKPAPDILLECLKRLGSRPERSVYVGDSTIDILAAKAAKVRSIGVLSGASDRASMESVQPELILDHIGQVPAALRKE